MWHSASGRWNGRVLQFKGNSVQSLLLKIFSAMEMAMINWASTGHSVFLFSSKMLAGRHHDKIIYARHWKSQKAKADGGLKLKISVWTVYRVDGMWGHVCTLLPCQGRRVVHIQQCVEFEQLCCHWWSGWWLPSPPYWADWANQPTNQTHYMLPPYQTSMYHKHPTIMYLSLRILCWCTVS